MNFPFSRTIFRFPMYWEFEMAGLHCSYVGRLCFKQISRFVNLFFLAGGNWKRCLTQGLAVFSGRIIIPRTSLDVWFGLLIFTCPQLKICSAIQATTRSILAEQRFLTKQYWISDHLGSPISGYSLIHKKNCSLIDYMQCLRKQRLFYRLAWSLTSCKENSFV